MTIIDISKLNSNASNESKLPILLEELLHILLILQPQTYHPNHILIIP